MSLTHDDFDAACKAITGRAFSGDKLKLVVRPSPDLMSRLLKLHETVGQIANTRPDILDLPEVIRALEQQLKRNEFRLNRLWIERSRCRGVRGKVA